MTPSRPYPDIPGVKLCHKCGCAWPADKKHFRADKNCKDGLEPWCKACRSATTKPRPNRIRTKKDPSRDPLNFDIDVDLGGPLPVDVSAEGKPSVYDQWNDVPVGDVTRVERGRDFKPDSAPPDGVWTSRLVATQSGISGSRDGGSGMSDPKGGNQPPPPVTIPLVRSPAPLRRILFVPDTHVPYHSKRAFALMLKAAAVFQPDTVVILGDFADCYSISSHSKNPGRVRLLDSEVADVNECLTQIDALGAKEKFYISGNHEDRLERYLSDRAPELFNLVKVRDLFKLDERGWKYTPYKEHVELGKLYLTHDCGNAGAQAHVKALNTFGGNAVIGHTHRLAIHYQRNAHGESHVGAHFGWLGDVDAVDYLHRIQACAWSLGFGIGHMDENGVVYLQPIPIINVGGNLSCVVDGVLHHG